MDIAAAVQQLSALAQETRLAVFRELVQAGPEGVNPGALAERLSVAQATLSFHLKELRHDRGPAGWPLSVLFGQLCRDAGAGRFSYRELLWSGRRCLCRHGLSGA